MSDQAMPVQLIEPLPMTPKQESIVGAASKLFLERGYGAVSMDAIAADASVSKRTVYSYYQNKETLFADVMAMVCAEIGGRTECPLAAELLDISSPPPEILQKTGEYVLNIIASPQAIEMNRVVIAESGRFPEIGRAYYETGPRWVVEKLTEYLDALVATNNAEIVNTLSASRMFFGMVVFPIQTEIMLGIVAPISKDEIYETTKAAVDVFCPAFNVSQMLVTS